VFFFNTLYNEHKNNFSTSLSAPASFRGIRGTLVTSPIFTEKCWSRKPFNSSNWRGTVPSKAGFVYILNVMQFKKKKSKAFWDCTYFLMKSMSTPSY